MQGINEKDIRKNQYKLYLIVFAIVVCFLIIYTIIWEINYYRDYGYFKKTSAEVVDHEKDGELLYDIIVYEVNNVYYKKTTSYISKNEINDIITIYYDENNPIGVIYNLDYRRIVLPLLCGGLVIILTTLSIMYIFNFNTMQNKKNYKKKQKNKKI